MQKRKKQEEKKEELNLDSNLKMENEEIKFKPLDFGGLYKILLDGESVGLAVDHPYKIATLYPNELTGRDIIRIEKILETIGYERMD